MEIPEGLPKIEADFEALCRVIRGLVDNAIKYTPEGGRVIVSARIVGDNVAISVEDNGAESIADDLPHVFENFFERDLRCPKAKPTIRFLLRQRQELDSDLYLAKHIVEQLGGQITVESEVGARYNLYRAYSGLGSRDNTEITDKEDADVEAIAGS